MLDLLNKADCAALFRQRLAQALGTSGLSRNRLSQQTGVDRSTISQLLNPEETRLPGGYLVARLARTLGVSSDWLLGLSDAPESVGEVLAAALAMPKAERALVDEQILAWHREAQGFKIRHVPATLPDMLKTTALLRWDLRGTGAAPEELEGRISAARERLAWMRQSENDYEIAMPLHELRAMAAGTGYYAGLPHDSRAEQLDWMAEVLGQTYPGLRLFLFDMHKAFSAPLTLYGQRLAVIYLGRNYLKFRDRDRVKTLVQHFDWLVRESEVSPRDAPDTVRSFGALLTE